MIERLGRNSKIGRVLDLPLCRKDGEAFMDDTVYGNLCTPHNGAYWTPDGWVFGGTNEYIDCGNNAGLNAGAAITIAAWFKTDYADTQFIISKYANAGDASYELYSSSLVGGGLRFRLYDNVGGVTVNSDVFAGDDKWHHVVGTLKDTTMSIYVDGVLENTGTLNNDIETTTADVEIGRRGGATHYFIGSVAGVLVLNYALTAKDVADLYRRGRPSQRPFVARTFTFNVATSASPETFALPLEAGGEYDFRVDWGDTTIESIQAYNDPNVIHSYATAGTHEINITGTLKGWRFNNAGDCAKMRDIKAWGCLQLGNSDGYFYGCTGLTVSATDILDLIGTTTLRSIFNGCSSLTTLAVGSWDVGSVTNLQSFVYSCSSLTTLAVGSWDVGSVSSFSVAFYGCSSLTTLAIGSWDMSGATSLNYAFGQCSLLTDPAINNWDITALVTASNFMNGAKPLSTAVYDATLIAWEGQVEQPNVTISFGTSKYTGGGAAEAARNALVANGWNITDGGIA